MRQVRIATTAFLVPDGPSSPASNLDRALSYVEKAARRGADIVCLPETVTTVHVSGDPAVHADPFPGPVTKAFGHAARQGSLCVVAPYLTRVGRRIYNQATIFDRRGAVAGYYRKVQPTGEELRFVTAGDALPVVRLDFGSIAVMLCMDIYFPEIPRLYAARGAEIVFWPTVTHGPTQEGLAIQLRSRAIDYSVVMVESNIAGYAPYAPYGGRFKPATARIVDQAGDVLAQTGRREGLAVADVDLDEIRLTSQCVLLREPDHIKQDLARLMQRKLYAREYARLARGTVLRPQGRAGKRKR